MIPDSVIDIMPLAEAARESTVSTGPGPAEPVDRVLRLVQLMRRARMASAEKRVAMVAVGVARHRTPDGQSSARTLHARLMLIIS